MVTLIVVAAIGVVVVIATDLFKEESLTRVQETNKDVAESLSEQVFDMLKDTTDKVTLMAQTLAQNKTETLSSDSQQLLQNILRFCWQKIGLSTWSCHTKSTEFGTNFHSFDNTFSII